MHIEKNRKSPVEKNQFSSGEKKPLMFRINHWISSQRLNSRNKLFLNPINLATAVAFIPVVLGVSQVVPSKSRFSKTLDKNEYFFEKTLPVFTEFKPKLNFETFEYISKSNSKMSHPTSNTLMFGQSNFITRIKKSNSLSSNKFNKLFCDLYFLPSGNFVSKTSSIQALARNLDELPAYIEGFKKSSTLPVPESLFMKEDKFITEKFPISEIFRNFSNLEQSKVLENQTKNKNIYFSTISTKKKIFGTELKTKIPLIHSLKYKGQNPLSQEGVSFLTKFYEEHLEFQNTLKQLNHELEILFTQQDICFFSNDFWQDLENEEDKPPIFRKKSLNVLFGPKNEEKKPYLEKIQKLEKKLISEDSPGFRFMSGYNYPDMNAEDVRWLYSRAPWKKIDLTNFILETSSLPSTSQHYEFNVKTVPQFSIKQTETSLQNPESNRIFFIDQSFVLDLQRALDWKIKNDDLFRVRKWFHTYVSPKNPLIQSLDNFFFFDNVVSSNTDKHPEFYDLTQKSVFYFKPVTESGKRNLEYSVKSAPSAFSPSRISFHVSSGNQEGNTRFIRTVDVDLSKTRSAHQFVPIPILEVQRPIFTVVSTSTNFHQKFQNYSPYFNFTSQGNPDSFFSTDSFNNTALRTKQSFGQYTKSSSLFFKSRNSKEGWLENWEPLTSRSWLLITKLSFALFVFNVFKSGFLDYGRELVEYLVELVAGLEIVDYFLQEQIQILLGNRDKGYRIVLQSQKTLHNIVGIQKLLPEISELVWFLRNSARDFALSKTLPRGILLTGPPGTGKTLLVQALAGEAKVPVVVLSGSALIDPEDFTGVKIQMVFQEARQLAPCIVFIDEIDTLAQKRSGVLDSPLGPPELSDLSTSKLPSASSFGELQKKQDSQMKTDSQDNQVNLLIQFLIELDGIKGRDGVIVIGATNRPEVLDPAVVRPGRLDKVFQIGLPGHQKRVEILQFYGQGLGYEKNLPWDYLGDRTAGFTAADLATLMNESTIKAILTKPTSTEISQAQVYFNRPLHTIQTIEHGLDRLTTSESEKYTVFKTKSLVSLESKMKREPNSKSVPNFSFSGVGQEHEEFSLTVASKISILRLAYYQAGKIVLSSLLETHPKSVVASLWPRRPTIRSAQIAANLQKSVFEFARRCEITDRLVGCYAGKAAEILFVQHFFSNKDGQLSTLGLEDLIFAQKLVSCILEKWSLYSKKNKIQRTVYLSSNFNTAYTPETLEFYTEIAETTQNPPTIPRFKTQIGSFGVKAHFSVTGSNAQIYYSIPWWQQEISSQLESINDEWLEWGFFHLIDPELSEDNPDSSPFDDFYHTSSGLKNVKQAVSNLEKLKSQPAQKEKVLPNSNTFGTGENKLEQKTRLEPTLKKLVESQTSPNLQTPSKKLKEISLPEKGIFSWNDIALLTRDYPGHSLILQCFNKALVILNQNRELVDRLVVELLYHEILRQPEIEGVLKEFNVSILLTKEELSLTPFENKQKLKILESSWGFQSLKPTPKWIDFAEFSQQTT